MVGDKQKLYCYVDETGQHTKGKFFLVAVVVVKAEDRESHKQALLSIERRTGKRSPKWTRTRKVDGREYLRQVIQAGLGHRIRYALYWNTTEYDRLTSQTIAATLSEYSSEGYGATILVDGLAKSLQSKVATALRRLGVNVRKVRGVADDREPYIRLADAVAGLVRNARVEKDEAASRILSEAASELLEIT